MATDLAASHVIDFNVFLAPQVGLEPTTLRLTGESSTVEPTCYQRSRQEQRGKFGVSMARNSAKNSAKSALELSIRP
jgi:hypothetical protein